MLVIYLLASSFVILVAAFFVWRATSSRPSLISGIFGCIVMLVAARMVSAGAPQPDMAIGLPLLAGMLFWGRALGTWMRVKKEPFLRDPAITWTLLGGLCVFGAGWIYKLLMMH